MDQARSLNDLPSTSDEYWKESEVELRKRQEVAEHRHYFEKVEGAREGKCRCGFGLFLSAEDGIKDGHLYQNGQLIY